MLNPTQTKFVITSDLAPYTQIRYIEAELNQNLSWVRSWAHSQALNFFLSTCFIHWDSLAEKHIKFCCHLNWSL